MGDDSFRSEEGGFEDIPVAHLYRPTELHSADEVDRASKLMDSKGIDLPIMEGIDMGDGPPRLVGDSDSEDEEPGAGTQNDDTSDEEAELPGTTRPKRGAGWWGRGPTLRPHRKGIAKTFIDGAGFPSPGRWNPKQRNLPEDGTAEKLKSIFKRGLQDSVEQLPGGSLRTAMAALAAGKCDDSPFPKDVVDRVRMDLRLALKKDGFGDGLPEEGDVDQVTEVRLMRALLEAFKDPDFYFCTWWARGVWIGAPDRVLPRAPALYDRKT